MCRLFAHLGSAPTTVNAALGSDADAFASLSGRHKDGWGLVGLDATTVARAGDTTAAQLSAGYAWASSSLVSRGLLMHFRLASPGTPVVEENLHPFEAVIPGVGPVAFAHNGHMFDVPALRALVAKHSDQPRRGSTDSESYAQLVFALMQRLSPERALAQAASMIQDVTDVVALNAMLLTPTRLHALQWVEPSPRQDGFAHPLDPELFRLRLRQDASQVTVASNEWEPSTDEWDTVPERRVISFERAA